VYVYASENIIFLYYNGTKKWGEAIARRRRRRGGVRGKEIRRVFFLL